MKRSTLLAACLLAASTLNAQTAPPGMPASGMGPGGGGRMAGDMNMMPIMEHMQKDMAGMRMSGNPDRDFAMMMQRHHQGAIDMAQEYLRHGKDKQLRAMAQKMIRDQKKEIAELKKQERQEKQ
jgi:uncharacterized protein (DUF305 family)